MELRLEDEVWPALSLSTFFVKTKLNVYLSTFSVKLKDLTIY